MLFRSGVPVIGGYGLEVWTGVAANAAAWGYVLLPALGAGKIGEFTIENGAATFAITSKSKEGSAWGQGPTSYLPIGAGSGGTTPSRLATAIGPKDYVHMERVTVAPPAVQSGLVALSAA